MKASQIKRLVSIPDLPSLAIRARNMNREMKIHSLEELVENARKVIPTIAPIRVAQLNLRKSVIVDVRESDELEYEGTISGSIHIPRGVLELALNPGHPFYHTVLKRGKLIVIISKVGIRSALAAKSLREMGFSNVKILDGGLVAWRTAGLSLSPILKLRRELG